MRIFPLLLVLKFRERAETVPRDHVTEPVWQQHRYDRPTHCLTRGLSRLAQKATNGGPTIVCSHPCQPTSNYTQTSSCNKAPKRQITSEWAVSKTRGRTSIATYMRVSSFPSNRAYLPLVWFPLDGRAGVFQRTNKTKCPAIVRVQLAHFSKLDDVSPRWTLIYACERNNRSCFRGKWAGHPKCRYATTAALQATSALSPWERLRWSEEEGARRVAAGKAARNQHLSKLERHIYVCAVETKSLGQRLAEPEANACVSRTPSRTLNGRYSMTSSTRRTCWMHACPSVV